MTSNQIFGLKRYKNNEVIIQLPKGTYFSAPKEKEESLLKYIKKQFKGIFIL